MVLTWTDELAIGLPAVDAQHLGIFEAMQRLHRSVAEGWSRDISMGMAAEVIELFELHFVAEENFMRSIRYPDVGIHTRVHSAFFSDVSGVIYRIETCDSGVIPELAQCAWRWAFDHVLVMDKELARYAAEMA